MSILGAEDLHHFAFFRGSCAYCLHFVGGDSSSYTCVDFADLQACPEGIRDFQQERHGVYPPVVVAQAAEVIGCLEAAK